MLYQQIASNKRKTYLVFAVFFTILATIGAVIGYLFFDSIGSGIVISLVITVIYALLMYFKSTSLVMQMNGATKITASDQAPMLWHIVEDLSFVAKIPQPDIYIIDDPSPNAFATGRDPKHSAVAVTSGLYDMMDRQELEGVLAHEISHIRNYDIRVSTISVALSSAIVFISSMLANMYRWSWLFGSNDRDDDDSRGNIIRLVLWLVGLVFAILGPMIATIVRLAISRNREYLADASGVELTRNPAGLIGALHKLADNTQPMQQVDDASAALYITNPLKHQNFAHLFDTHPPLADRIKRLEKM
ncbi:zinc metalloprotease HtpX [Bombilactobacillus thymidiniphilus]|uniref:Protease HtpX homolog n=1 Tax=Bombilactobacillus thymidiniphilus TaxID=2923363 RepID=A0ABY4PCC6_9LACO|nr:zinc metalloprotease HtpX [Bombilactobacillus thymidiniphilus]UQS83197.1 zinc metalloprotease HtpX [Bombilactobacillus thymidiniphilus]